LTECRDHRLEPVEFIVRDLTGPLLTGFVYEFRMCANCGACELVKGRWTVIDRQGDRVSTYPKRETYNTELTLNL